jgi:hypothetical protein
LRLCARVHDRVVLSMLARDAAAGDKPLRLVRTAGVEPAQPCGQFVREMLGVSKVYERKLNAAAQESGYAAAEARLTQIDGEILRFAPRAFEAEPATVAGIVAQAQARLPSQIPALGRTRRTKHTRPAQKLWLGQQSELPGSRAPREASMFEAEDHDGARDGRLFALTMEDFTLPSQRNGRPDLRRNSRSWTASSPKLWRRRLQPSTTTTTHSPPPPESRWRPRKPGKFGCASRRKKSFTQRICGSGIVQFSGCSNVTLNDFWATTARPSQSCSELGPGGSVRRPSGRLGGRFVWRSKRRTDGAKKEACEN